MRDFLLSQISRKISASFLCAALLFLNSTSYANEAFKDNEIRVIKNKSFQKKFRLEADLSVGAIMNKSFIYTYMGVMDLGFHVSESFSVFGQAGYGITLNKTDCTVLGTKFGIEPLVTVMNWTAGGGLGYTPIYGKYQLSSGDVIYYDWFFTASAGIANVTRRNRGCVPANENKEPDPTGSLTVFGFTTGQRVFVDQHLSLNWNFRAIPNLPGQLADSKGIRSNIATEVMTMLSLGIGYFL